MTRKSHFVSSACRYWTLKRIERRCVHLRPNNDAVGGPELMPASCPSVDPTKLSGAPLIKRLHLEMYMQLPSLPVVAGASADVLSGADDDDPDEAIDRLERAVARMRGIKRELHTLETLTSLILQREEAKRVWPRQLMVGPDPNDWQKDAAEPDGVCLAVVIGYGRPASRWWATLWTPSSRRPARCSNRCCACANRCGARIFAGCPKFTGSHELRVSSSSPSHR